MRVMWFKNLGSVCILSVPLLILSLAAYCDFLGWHADLISHFRVQYAVLLLPFVLIATFQRNIRWIFLTLAGLGLNFIQFVPNYLPSPSAARTTPRLSIMQLNVYTGNRRHEDVIHLIRAAEPDIVALNEVDQTWLTALRPIEKSYPHRISRPRNDNFGIALYSRFPVRQSAFPSYSALGLPSIRATVSVQNRPVTILATHPLPPVSQEAYLERNRHLLRLSQDFSQIPGKRILIGDLNTTPYSAIFRRLLQQTGLKDARQGFGIQPTWSCDAPLFSLPIDHILISDGLYTENLQTGPNVGSDHRALMARLVLL